MQDSKTINIDPNQITVVTLATIKHNASLKPFWQPRHEREITQNFVDSIAESGGPIHPPIVTKFEGKYIAVAGNRRVRGSRAAKLKSIKVEVIPLDWDRIRRIQVAENEQREENSLEDKLHNILAFLQLDKDNKPKGMSYADVGKLYDYSHQQIRDLAAIATLAPKWMVTAIDQNKISYTEALKLVRTNHREGGDGVKLKEAFDEWVSNSKTSSSGKPKKQGNRSEKKPKPSTALITHWAYSNDTPKGVRLVLQIVLGDVSIADAKEAAGTGLNWMPETVPAKPKPKKEETPVEEEDLEEKLDAELEEEEEETDDELNEEEYDDEEDEDEEGDEDEDEDEYDDDDDEDDDEDEEDEEEEPAPVRTRTRKAPAKAPARRQPAVRGRKR